MSLCWRRLEGVWPGLFQFEMKPTPKEKVVLEGTDQIQLEPDDGIVRSYLISNNKGSFLVVSEARRCLRNEWKETAKSWRRKCELWNSIDSRNWCVIFIMLHCSMISMLFYLMNVCRWDIKQRNLFSFMTGAADLTLDSLPLNKDCLQCESS